MRGCGSGLQKLSLSLILVFSGLFLNSCGKKSELRVDGFESYVDAFRTSATEHGKELGIDDLIIEFGAPSSSQADATCYQGGFESPRIAVDRVKWEAMPEAKRTALLFHEMGHCVLGREHKPGSSQPNSCPDSVMNPFTLSAFCFENLHDYYLGELFGT